MAFVKTGLSFADARDKVFDALKESYEDYEIKRSLSTSSATERFIKNSSTFFCIPIFSAIIFLVVGCFQFSLYFLSIGTFIFLFVWFNFWLLRRLCIVEENELVEDIKQICNQYAKFKEVSDYHQSKNNGSKGDIDTATASIAKIVSGHPHVSIVTTWRNSEWQRIPALLLAEGDIIALGAGDVTPAKVWELSPTFARNMNSSRSLQDNLKSIWVKGKLLGKHEKIPLRQNLQKWSEPQEEPQNVDQKAKQEATALKAPSAVYERHRSVPPASTELLALSGDLRCFLMAETPIREFVTSLLKQQQNLQGVNCSKIGIYESSLFPLFQKPKAIPADQHGKESAIRMLLFSVLREAMWVSVYLSITSLVVLVLRCFLTDQCFEPQQFSSLVLLPIATLALTFSPIYLPLELLLCEAVGLSNILCTTEAILQVDATTKAANSAAAYSGTSSSTRPASSCSNITKPRGTGKRDGTTGVSSGTGYTSSGVESARTGVGAEASCVSDEFDDATSDEFLDEELDDRAGEVSNIKESASHLPLLTLSTSLYSLLPLTHLYSPFLLLSLTLTHSHSLSLTHPHSPSLR